jgi:dATP pyrophosphohydrolase
MPRAPYNVFVIPYILEADTIKYCVMLRSDMENGWQFIAGGGEDDETPLEAAIRETWEESGIPGSNQFTALTTKGDVPVFYFSKEAQEAWGPDTYIIPNHAFAVQVRDLTITLSHEHTEYRWLEYADASQLLKFDSNKTALWELKCRLERGIV